MQNLLSRFFVCPFVALTLVLSLATPVSAEPDTITIGSYNVKNFFDVYDDPYAEDESVKVKPRQEVKLLAQAINKLNADVVVFQELENEHLLKAMVDEFMPESGYTEIAAQRTNSGRGINLGVISRYPILELRSYRFQQFTHPDKPGRTWQFARDLLRISIDAGLDKPIDIFCIHFKSNRDGPGDPSSMLWRTAESIRLKQIVQAEYEKDPEALIVATGDFNSNYETRDDQPRPWPAMAHLLAPLDDGTQLFTDVHAALDDDARVTIPGHGRYPPATFDYVLVSPAMAKRYIKDSANIIRDKQITQGSDHRPVSASFRLDP